MKLYRAAVFLILLYGLNPVGAQYYDTGTDPASIRWLQIKTDRFRVIYPESFGDEGIKFAKSLEESYGKLSVYYPGIKFRLPVIIHNYTVISNGYVAWAPRRMEIFPTPEQNSIPLRHIEQLTLHEMAHVMQMKSLYKGISNVLWIPFGEQYFGTLSAYIPMWMLEGDAVLMETMLSESGRGRVPSFSSPLKAIIVERGKMYSYDKMLLGSYRTYIPDEYKYGYQMASWLNDKYGHQLLRKSIEFAGRNPLSVFPVNISLAKGASLTKKKLFEEAFESRGEKWKNELRNLSSPGMGINIINPSKRREYINYHSPVQVAPDTIVAFKTTLYNPPAIVMINTSTGKEKRIHTPGYVNPYFLSGASGRVVWVEIHQDLRWENRQFSVVKVMDLRRGEVRQLTHRTRYMAAGISPDGRYVAAVENSISNSNNVIILDAFNGEVISRIQVPGGIYPQRPQWSDSGKEITFISLTEKGEGIIVLNIEKLEWEQLKSPARDDLQSTFLKNDSLFFVSSASGIDNIWVLTGDGREVRITDSRYGMYDLNISGNSIICTDYAVNGKNICRLEIGNVKGKIFEERKERVNSDFDVSGSLKKDQPGNSQYTPSPYRKWLHPFKFHSWMPFYADIDALKSDPSYLKPGFTLLSQNNLSTVISSLGYEYDKGNHVLHSKFTLKGWLPVFESSVDYGGTPDIIKPSDNIGDPSVINSALKVKNSISLPLRIESGNFTSFIWTSFSLNYDNSYIFLKEKGIYDYGQNEFSGRIYFSNYSHSGLRDIYPRWAQVVDYTYTFFPADKAIYGPMSTIRTSLYFPGFLRNHGIRLRFESDYQKPVKFILYNRASWPRGYDNIVSQDLKFFSADYVLPLFHPDLNIPGLLYIKRFRTGFFYDYAEGTNNTYIKESGNTFKKGPESFRSFGTEVISDFYVFRIPFMISGGVQGAWKDIRERPSIKMILKLDIYGMMIGRNKL